jgi:SAM-dependent methyltransferase
MQEKQLAKIREAYDLTVQQYMGGLDPLENVPDDFKNSIEYQAFAKESGPSITGSNAPENKEFLNPKIGMKFLDAGCCANLANYRFDKWPSIYYGIDISTELIKAMKDFTVQHNISIGGLEVADLTALPFEDNYFNIASLIGVFEYFDLIYTESALAEMNRVLKPQARMVVDIPNMEHSYVEVMFKLEKYLGRPNIPKSRIEFEKILSTSFNIMKADDKYVILKYFVETKK